MPLKSCPELPIGQTVLFCHPPALPWSHPSAQLSSLPHFSVFIWIPCSTAREVQRGQSPFPTRIDTWEGWPTGSHPSPSVRVFVSFLHKAPSPPYTHTHTALSTTHIPQGSGPRHVSRTQNAAGESSRGQVIVSTLEKETGIHVLAPPAELHEMSWGSLMLKAESHCCVGAKVALSRLLPAHDRAQW